VFDEHVFPFASLSPNTRARLRVEFSLLPDVLLNPSTQFGDAVVHDRHRDAPVITDNCSSAAVPSTEKKIRAQKMKDPVRTSALQVLISCVTVRGDNTDP
jgi:hypothetical protein